MKYFLLVILLSYLFSVSLAQDGRIDSLKNLYDNTNQDTSKIKLLLEIGDVWEFQNPDTALDYYKKALALAESKAKEYKGKKSEKDFTILKASCLRYIGIVYDSLGNLQTAEKYYKNALSADKKYDNYIGMAASCNNLGTLFYSLSRYDVSIDYYEKAIQYYKKVSDKNPEKPNLKAVQGISLCYNNIGNIYSEQCDLEKALDYYYMALKTLEKIDFKRGISACLSNIGVVHQDLGNFDVAIDFFNRSLKIEKELGNDDKIADLYLNIGVTYWEETNDMTDTAVIRKKFELALEYYNMALEIDLAMNKKSSLAKIYANIGVIFFDLGKMEKEGKARNQLFDKSLNLYEKAHVLFEEIGDRNGLASNFTNLGFLYHWKSNYRKAINCCYRSFLFADSTRHLIWKRNACDCLSKAYYALNNYDSAFHYKMMYIETNDSVFSQEKARVLAESGAKYEDEKKQILIDNLNKEKALNQAEYEKSEQEFERQRYIIWISVAGIVLLVLFFISVFRLYILKRKANILLAEQKAQIVLKNSKLEQLNEEINAQKDEIEAQRDMVMVQKNHIESQKKEITDSINYAKRIQDAVLPSGEYLGSVLKDQFVISIPRDIVSGTFYWSNTIDDRFVFVMAGCSGFGVPGALLSMLGISYLNGSVRGNRIPPADEVISGLENAISSALKTESDKSGYLDQKENTVQLCLCSVNLKTGKMDCLSKGIPVFILKNKQVIEHFDQEFSHINKFEINISENDVVYISTMSLLKLFSGPDFNNKPYDLKTMFSEISEESGEIQKHQFKTIIENLLMGDNPDEDICLAGFKIL
ncbi:MAG TPA: hypothetical protein DEA97_05775 [Bacteroidales bacterium]|nr:hypothetical protein [Bacteroidales bacterium]